MPNSLKGSEYLYKNPQARADDMMEAFLNNNIKGIISNIGGEDSIRIHKYIDYNVIKNNPKIFLGYSDTTVSHFICYKAGLQTFYGPSVLCEFAENVKMHAYTVKSIEKSLFSSNPIGKIESSKNWTSEFLSWNKEENNLIERKLNKEKTGYELLQGKGIVQGELLGGCLEVLDFMKGTDIWLPKEYWKNKILFLETSEEKPLPDLLRRFLRSLGEIGILNEINGIIFGKPQEEKYFDEYKTEIIKVVRNEYSLENIPILYNLNFGHNAPMFILPYGVKAEINCEEKSFSIIETATI